MKNTIRIGLLSLLFFTIEASAQWAPLGSGLAGRVRSIAIFNNKIYAAGTFAGRVKSFNEATSTWENVGQGLGSGTNDSVNTLCVHNGILYAGGAFSTDGNGAALKYVAKLNASGTWEQAGTKINNLVRVLYSDGTDLYIGGAFNANGVTRIGKLASGDWVQVGNATGAISNGIVNAIVKYNNQLFIGGTFNQTFGRLDGSTWNTISGMSGTEVYSLQVFLNKIYIGSNNHPFINTSTGSSVAPAFNTLDGAVRSLTANSLKIFGGGSFNNSPSLTQPMPHFFSYNGSTPFTSVDQGFNGDVFAIALKNGKVVVGGSFTGSGVTTLNSIAISTQTIDVPETDAVVAHAFYPNPMMDRSVFELETRETLVQPAVQIYDASGRLVRSLETDMEINGNQLRVIVLRDQLTAGYYLLSVSDNGRPVYAERFLVR